MIGFQLFQKEETPKVVEEHRGIKPTSTLTVLTMMRDAKGRKVADFVAI
jgi:hypothetical protein